MSSRNPLSLHIPLIYCMHKNGGMVHFAGHNIIPPPPHLVISTQCTCKFSHEWKYNNTETHNIYYVRDRKHSCVLYSCNIRTCENRQSIYRARHTDVVQERHPLRAPPPPRDIHSRNRMKSALKCMQQGVFTCHPSL